MSFDRLARAGRSLEVGALSGARGGMPVP